MTHVTTILLAASALAVLASFTAEARVSRLLALPLYVAMLLGTGLASAPSAVFAETLSPWFTTTPLRALFVAITAGSMLVVLVTARRVAETAAAMRALSLGVFGLTIAYLAGDVVVFAAGFAIVASGALVGGAPDAPSGASRIVRVVTMLVLTASLFALVGGLFEHGAARAFDPTRFDRSMRHGLVVELGLLGIAIGLLAPFPFHFLLSRTLVAGRAARTLVVLAAQPAAMLALHAALPHRDGHASAIGWLASWMVVGGVYTSLAALGQSDLRRAIGFVVSCANGLAVAGVATGTVEGSVAGVLQALATSAIAMGLTLATHALHRRVGELDCRLPSGLAELYPRLGLAFLLLSLAALGFPAGLQFFAEDLLLQGFLVSHPAMSYAVLALSALNGVVLLRGVFMVFFGVRTRELPGSRDLTRLELAGPLGLFVVGLALVAVSPALGGVVVH